MAATPDDEVAGRLTNKGHGEMELDLVGSLLEPMSTASSPEERIRIQGIAGNKLLTLESCLRTTHTFAIPGPTKERYSVPIAFEGANFEDDEPLEFSSFRLRLEHLEHWVGRTGIKTIHNKTSSGLHRFAIDYTPASDLTTKMTSAELKLTFNYATRNERFKSSIEEYCEFVVAFHQLEQMESISRVSAALQDLVTIGADAPASVVSVSVFHPDISRTLPSGKVFYEPIRLHTKHRGGLVSVDKAKIFGPSMLFTFDDIGGIGGVARWLETSARFQPVIAMLTNHRYFPLTYGEHRFFNVVTAAETLERIRLQQQSFPFRIALKSLADKAGDTFLTLVGDVDSWIDRIANTRVKNVVHRGLHESEDPDLYVLSESVYFLVVLCLLRECDVADEALANFRRHQRFDWLASRLRKIL